MTWMSNYSSQKTVYMDNHVPTPVEPWAPIQYKDVVLPV